jgi:hypothetical protein
VVKNRVRFFVEGGATGKTADSDFRRAWKKFLRELLALAQENGYFTLEVVRGKGRSNTFNLFLGSKTHYPNDLCVLLVDAEQTVVPGRQVWDVVAKRPGDNWQRPHWATERHLYLMVCSVETWLLTDHKALLCYYKSNFNADQLPTVDLEARSKSEIEKALKRATEYTPKGPYKHGQANEIIELVSPDKVRTLAHGRRMFEVLGGLIKGEALL